MVCPFRFLVVVLVSSSWPALSSAAHDVANKSCKKDADCHHGNLCYNGQCLTACGGGVVSGGLQIGCQNGYECIDNMNDNCDPRVGRNCPGTCVGAPGESCGVLGIDCPALRCPCRLCDNGVDTFGCCGKCVVTIADEKKGDKECSGVVPEAFCPAAAPKILGAPGDSCGTAPKDCPALDCPCNLCSNGIDQFGCCDKCVVTMNDRGEKFCSGSIPEAFCPQNTDDPCDQAIGFINERVCAALYQYDCQRDCQKDFCQTLFGFIRRPNKAVKNRVWIPVACQR